MRGDLVDTDAFGLFISEKLMGKPSLSVNKSTKRIKTINFKDVGVAQIVELQITQWKDNKYFEVIHLDDYDYVFGLHFLDKINDLLVSSEDCMCILDT